jgi:hypothetical protein
MCGFPIHQNPDVHHCPLLIVTVDSCYNELGFNDNSAIASTFPKSRSVCAHLYGSIFVYNEHGYNENSVLTSILADPLYKERHCSRPIYNECFSNKRALRPRHYQKPTLNLESRPRCFMLPMIWAVLVITGVYCIIFLLESNLSMPFIK